ncbi:uncharacterized protein [Palaemon carinicauda]|uniref:uncharacterized protein isoform X2 n=1 Tax=Palaemon carinicauda TaxID=392227 RepID=UPI0035B5FFAB
MASYNPNASQEGGEADEGQGRESEGNDPPLREEDLIAMISTIEDLLRNPSGNEQVEETLHQEGERFLNLQPPTPGTSRDEYPSSSYHQEPLFSQPSSSDAYLDAPHTGQQAMYGYPAPYSSDQTAYPQSSDLYATPYQLPCGISASHGGHSSSLEDYAPPNPRKTSRGGFRPSVEKIYDNSEEGRIQRRRELGNEACRRHRRRRRDTLESLREALMELQEKNHSLQKQQELLRLMKELYQTCMNEGKF